MANGNLPEIQPVRTPETGVEKRESKESLPASTEKPRSPEAPAAAAEKAPAAPPAAPPRPVAPPKDANLVRIERALEANLGDVYVSLPKNVRLRFKLKGEETAIKINRMMERAKLNAKAVLKLIRSWLKLIPGVNRYFLEQEAKIKTDRMALIARERREKG